MVLMNQIIAVKSFDDHIKKKIWSEIRGGVAPKCGSNVSNVHIFNGCNSLDE
jgi:hypothetical protein